MSRPPLRRRLPAPLAAGARRAGWGFVDQALSSATNFALGVFVAATVAPADFGAFSLVYASYGVCLGLSSGLVSTPLIVRHSAASTAERSEASQRSVASAFLVGAAAGLLFLLLSRLAPPTMAGPLAVLGATMPGLLTQDAWRYAFNAQGRPQRAATNDATWALLQVIGTAALLAGGAVSATSMIAVWGGSATVAALLGAWQAHAFPPLRGNGRWIRAHADLGVRYAVESIAHRSGLYLALYLVGLIAGLSAVAALRGALLLVTGPLILLYVGASFAAVPEGVRLLERAPRDFPRATALFTAAITGAAALWCGLVLIFDNRLGPLLLGQTWPLAQPLVVPLVVFALVQAISVAPSQGLWSLGAASRSLRIQLLSVVMTLGGTFAGAAVAGPLGAAEALVITTVVSTVLWCDGFRRSFSEHLSRRPDASTQRPAALAGSVAE